MALPVSYGRSSRRGIGRRMHQLWTTSALDISPSAVHNGASTSELEQLIVEKVRSIFRISDRADLCALDVHLDEFRVVERRRLASDVLVSIENPPPAKRRVRAGRKTSEGEAHAARS